MGRGNKKRRLSVEEELEVNSFLENKNTPYVKKESKFKVKNFSARTDKQAELINSIEEYEVTIGVGEAGTGKSYVALAAALSLLETSPSYEQIILCKSVTTLPEEEIGFIKGSVSEKMEPFMMSYQWNVDKLMGKNAYRSLVETGKIQILPLAFIRGLSIDNSIVIIDEAQNLSDHTFKSIVTRIGNNSKYIFLGDIAQVDKKKKADSCLAKVLEAFKDEDFVGTVEFGREDCVRNKIIPLILDVLEKIGI